MDAPLVCYQHLAIAVLEKSILDAWSRDARVKADAERFLRSPDRLFDFWCQAAQVDPRYVRRAALEKPKPRLPRPGNLIAGVETEDDV